MDSWNQSLARAAATRAVAAARHFDKEAEAAVAKSEKTVFRKIRDQHLKSAAEFIKGNCPMEVDNGYLIESRSSFVGKLVEVSTASSTVEDAILRFTVTGGKVYFVSLSEHMCTCEGAESGECWHLLHAQTWADTEGSKEVD